MRVTLERSNLLKSLNHVQRVVERRNTIPILSNVLLKADEGVLTLKATDLDIEVTETTPASIEQSGATTVSAHMLYDIVRKLPDGSEVMMAVSDDNGLSLVSGRSQFRLQMLPESDFPDLTAGEFSHTFRMACEDFKTLIDRTQFAISTEETRYYLNGIYFHTVEDEGELKLRAVATDGHRLAQAQTTAPDGSAGMPGIIVPRKAVAEVQKLLEEPDASVTVELSETKIRFTVNQVVMTSKLIDGTFPDYSRVIPTANDKILKLDPKAFMQGVDRVSTIATEKTRAVKMALDRDRITLSVTSPENGTASEEVPGEYTSLPFEIGFNSRYLLDILGQIDSDLVEVHLADAAAPTLIRENDKAPALYVLMPMRV